MTLAAFALLATRTAAAQTTPPAQSTAPAHQPTPGLEAGDTSPPPGAPPVAVPPDALVPVTPLPPAAAPGLSAQTSGEVPPLVPPTAPAKRPLPFYHKAWFWCAIAVAVMVGTFALVIPLSGQDPVTPSTRLGDMRAF